MLKDFECEIKYYLGKSNASTDALSQKICSLSLSTIDISHLIDDCCTAGLEFDTDSRPIRVFAIRAEPELFIQIREAQRFDLGIQNSIEKVKAGHQFEFQVSDDALYVNNRIVVPDVPDLRQRILREAHCSRFSIHPGGRKMYNDLKNQFWCKKMKRDVTKFVSR